MGWISERDANRWNAALALLLSVVAVISTSGRLHGSGPRGDVWACAAALLLTVPVFLRRDRPLTAMLALAAGSVFNWLVVGSYVRCAASLPALFLCTFAVADRRELRYAVLGLAAAWLAAVAQAHSDPQLAGFSIGACILVTILWGSGRLVRWRRSMITELRRRNTALRQQRDRTAAMALAADRAQMAGALEDQIGERINRLADAVQATSADPARPVEPALAHIEDEGRQTLAAMREIVGAYQQPPPTAPQPSLARLDHLLASFGPGRARLRVHGDPVRVSPGVELSAYRVIERLLEPMAAHDGAHIDVTLDYRTTDLRLTVEGTTSLNAEIQAAVAGAREWVALHAGGLESVIRHGSATVTVRLPLLSADVASPRP